MLKEFSLENVVVPIPRYKGRSERRRNKKINRSLTRIVQILDEDIFTPASADQITRLESPSIPYLNRLMRRETVLQRPNERVGAYPKEMDHKQPAEIANNAYFIESDQGSGWMPFHSDRPLDLNGTMDKSQLERLKKIKEVYIIQHGVMRNAKDYHEYFMNALGKEYNPETMLVITPQFLAPVDLRNPKIPERTLQDMEPHEVFQRTPFGFKIKNVWDDINPDDVLRWRYNDWRGAESALNPNAPIDSFTAMDSLIERLLSFTPNAKRLELRGNSEGGQFMNRYLAYSKALNRIEYDRTVDQPKIQIRGIFSNPGTVHYFDHLRPIFNKEKGKEGEIVGWKPYAYDSRVNTWPFGLYDPPPYILESLSEWPRKTFEEYYYQGKTVDPLVFAIRNFIKRAIFTIGEEDDVVNGFHFPKGSPEEPYHAQGITRRRRMNGLFESVARITIAAPQGYFPIPRAMEIGQVYHSAQEIFFATEIIKRLENIEGPLQLP